MKLKHWRKTILPILSMIFRGRSKTPTTCKMETFVSFQPMVFVTKSSILNAVGVLDPPMPKVSRHMVSNRSHE